MEDHVEDDVGEAAYYRPHNESSNDITKSSKAAQCEIMIHWRWPPSQFEEVPNPR